MPITSITKPRTFAALLNRLWLIIILHLNAEPITIYPNSSEADRMDKCVELIASLVTNQFTQVATCLQPLTQDFYFHSGIGHRCGHGVRVGIDGHSDTVCSLKQ